MKLLISLFDFSGVWSQPYLDNDWKVIRIDIKNGIDILTWDYMTFFSDIKEPIECIGILAAIPCTDYALSGAKHFKKKDLSGQTKNSDALVDKTREIIEFFSGHSLIFWSAEQPMTRLHKLHKWLGVPVLKFNPCDYAGYSDNTDANRYNKQTWLFGRFNIPQKQYLSPLQKEFPGFKKLGGKSEKTKELRSTTPDGFAKAFYLFNNDNTAQINN